MSIYQAKLHLAFHFTNMNINRLQALFAQHTDPEKAQWQTAYMKNQFIFLGIAKPTRAKLEKEVFKTHPLKTQDELIRLLNDLWQADAREFQYTACELAYYYKKIWSPALLPTFEHMIRTKSWWDTVDDIAANLVGDLVFKYPELIKTMDAWIHDENLWIRRSALLFQLRWKKETNQARLFDYCSKTMHEKDFFIRKAIGWVLREYSKTNPQAVKHFIDTHRNKLSTLSIREGSKYT